MATDSLSVEHVVGIISDTHGVLLPEAIQELRASTGTIIHAGDIGEPRYKSRMKAAQLIQELEKGTQSAVFAVTGNVDDVSSETKALYPPYRTLKVAGRKILVIHICGFPPAVDPSAASIIGLEQPDVVIFGHSHVPGVQLHEGTLFVNPGSAGPSRFRLPQSLAILRFNPNGLRVDFVALGSRDKSIPRAVTFDM